MRFSFKKALATVLSIALVLSTCVCALTVGAATLAGSIDIPDAEVELVDGKFTTTATINFDKAYEISYVAYQLDLPEDVTLVGADSTVEGTEFQVDLEKDLILVHYANSIQTIPVRMTFATALLSGSFDIAIAAAEFAEATEADLTLDFSDKGTITIGHECVAGEAVTENEVAATCTTDGSYDTVTYCTICKEEVSRETTTVPATGHAYDEGVVTTEPKCEEAGVKTFTCGVCGDTYTEAVGATGHTAGEAVKEKEVAADCTTDGSYDTVVYCSVCNAELSRETTTVPATGHDYVDGKCDVCGEADPNAPQGHVHAYTYEYDVKGHWQVCANEDGLCEEVTTAKEAHNFVDGVCACGLKKDANLKFDRDSISIAEASLEYNIRFSVSGILASDTYDDVVFSFTPNKYDKSTMNLVENPTTYMIHENEYKAAGSKFVQFTYGDFYLYELALDIPYQILGYKNGKLIAVSEVGVVSPVTKLKAIVTNSTNAKEKTTYTDLLVICDEYMKVTGDSKPGSDLDNTPCIFDANEELGIPAFDTSAKTVSVNKWEDTDDFDAFNSNFKYNDNTANHNVRVSVETAKVPFFNIRIMNNKTGYKDLDASKLVITASYTSKNSVGETYKPFTFDSAEDFNIGNNNNYIELKFDSVGLHDSDKVITFVATYDGEKIFEYKRSVESYTGAGQTAGSNTDAAMKALLHFGQSFRAYMGI